MHKIIRRAQEIPKKHSVLKAEWHAKPKNSNCFMGDKMVFQNSVTYIVHTHHHFSSFFAVQLRL